MTGRRRRSDDLRELSADDLAARLGVERPRRPRGPRRATAVPVDPVPTAPVEAPPPRAVRRRERRRVLWWDTATIVAGVLVALLASQALGSPQPGPIAEASATGAAGGAISAPPLPLATPTTVPPPQTLGPVVDPSLGLDATPTPIPVITLGPTPTATPTPKPGEPPVAGFTFVQVSGTRKVNFTSTSSGDITSYLWSFGDGGTATTPNPSHTFPSYKSYTVRLTVTGPGGSSVKTRTVPVLAPLTPTPPPPPPTADFTWSQVPDTLTVQFTNTSTGQITGYEWDFGDGTTSTSPNPPHTYGADGPYSVRLTVSGPGGSHSITITVTVEPLPTETPPT